MATIRDVARACGVSIATVSRVSNGSPRVSARTRQRVEAAAARLDYWPNSAARSLTTSRTHALGVLLPDLYGEFFSEVIRGIDDAARRAQLQILVSSSHTEVETLLLAARSMRGRIDGLIMMAPEEPAAIVKQVSRTLPVVLINTRFRSGKSSTVSIANSKGAHALVAHLAAHGHHRIAIVKGPSGNVDAEERLRGYRKALVDSGLEASPALEIAGDFTESSGYRAATQILQLDPRPTAVFAANDYMAIGLLSALHDAGVDVPADLAVAGFDDIAIAQYVSPRLTTVHVGAYALGSRAVQTWLSTAQSADVPPVHEVLPAKLVVRDSCGASTRTARSGRPMDTLTNGVRTTTSHTATPHPPTERSQP